MWGHQERRDQPCARMDTPDTRQVGILQWRIKGAARLPAPHGASLPKMGRGSCPPIQRCPALGRGFFWTAALREGNKDGRGGGLRVRPQFLRGGGSETKAALWE